MPAGEKMRTPIDDTLLMKAYEKVRHAEAITDLNLLIGTIAQVDKQLNDDTHDPLLLELFYGALAASANPDIRAQASVLLVKHLPGIWARDIICGLVADPDDIVCMSAMRVAGETGVTEIAQYLIKIVGPPSNTRTSSISPVGRGAAIARRALNSLLEVDEDVALDHVRTKERELAAQMPVSSLTAEPTSAAVNELVNNWLADRVADDASMVIVPCGVYSVGIDGSDVPDKRFAWQRGAPSKKVWMPPYLIDKHPVTVADYDRFCQDVQSTGHIYCHPLEPKQKNHWRNTQRDPRVSADHPVTGIDWFDAVAYARWMGKDLPSEYQWEIAARGPTGSIWPWGNDWRPEACNWFADAYQSTNVSLRAWRETLSESQGRYYPKVTTQPVTAHDDFASAFGVVDMIGNCWEWTRSELNTGGPYSPTIQRFFDGATSVVLKGGAWSSLPGQLMPCFRGQDAPFCRHDEIGFRCVITIPMSVLKSLIGPDSRRYFGRQVY